MKTLGEMKKLLIVAAAVTAALAAMYVYQMKVVTHLPETASVVTDSQALRALKNGNGEIGSTLTMTEVNAQEPVYLRLGTMYVGNQKIEATASLPFLVNDGASMLFMLGDAQLYDARFETVSSFTGMYLADGITYNYDKTQADEEIYLFAGLPSGLFLNALPLTIEIPGQNYLLPGNSILYFGENQVNYYRNDGGKLTYGIVPSTSMAQVSIGNLDMSYEELLVRLGIVSPVTDSSSTDDIQNGETGDVVNAEELEGGADSAAGTSEEEEEYPLTADEEQNERDTAWKEAQEAHNQAQQEAADQENQDESGEEGTSDSQTDDVSGGQNQEGGSSESGSGSAGGSSGSAGTGQAGSEEGTPGSSDGPIVPGEEVKVPFTVPQVTLSGIETDIYSLSGHLEFEDPSAALKRVTLELYWVPEKEDGTPAGNVSDQSKYQMMYRRTYRAEGDFTIDNLPPGTTIYIKGTMTYYTEGLETKEVTFYDRFEERVTTLPMSVMDPVYVDFEQAAGDGLFLSNQLRIYKLRFSGPNQNVLKKINRVAVKVKAVDQDGKVVLESSGLTISSLILNRDFLYQEEGGEYLSDNKQLSLPANSTITYELQLFDSFGNRLTNIIQGYKENEVEEDNSSLKVTGGQGSYVPEGTTYTCKTTPSVNISLLSAGTTQDSINSLKFQLSANDPHEAIIPDEEIKVRLFKGTELALGELVAEKILNAEDITGETAHIQFEKLTAGQEYCLQVFGDYDLQNNYGVYKEALLGSANASTVSLSSYGRVNYTLQASHVKGMDVATGEEEKYESATAQKIEIAVNETTTQKGLFDHDYVHHIEASLTATGTNSIVLEGTLNKDTLDALMIQGQGTQEIKQQEFILKDVFGEKAVWKGNGTEPTVLLSYRDFPETETKSFWDLFCWGNEGTLTLNLQDGSLDSFTAYQLYLTTYAQQGTEGKFHDVSGRTNSTRRVQFTTLRQMPEVTYEDFMVYSDQMNIYEICFHDPDQSIYNGEVTVSDGWNTQSYVLDYEEDEGGYLAEISMSDLRIGSQYTITISADQIRRSAGSTYRYYDETLFSTTFTAGDGISGELTLRRLAYALVNNGNSDDTFLKEDFDIYSGGYTNAYIGGSGTLIESAYWYATDYLPVEAGKVYYFDRVRNADTSNAYVAFYDADKQYVTGSYGYAYNGSYVLAPEGAAYIRYSTADSYKDELTIWLGGCYQMELEGAEIVRQVGEYTETGTETTYDIENLKKNDTDRLFLVSKSHFTTNHTMEFLDKDGDPLSTEKPYRGVSVEIPDEAVSVRVKGSYSAALYVADGEMKAWLDEEDYDKMQSVTDVEVRDSRSNLLQKPVYQVALYIDGQPADDGYQVTEGNFEITYTDGVGSGSSQLQMDCEGGKKYELVLTVEYRGRTLTLDTLSFEATLPKYIIEDEDDVYKLVRYKTAEFIVTNDLDLGDLYVCRSHTNPFNGSIDFQNHQVSVYRSPSTSDQLFRTLGSSAVLENLELNVVMDAESERMAMSYRRGLAEYNYGTIRNVIVNLDLGSGYYQKNICAGLVHYNYGTVENFALYYAAGSYNYVGYYFGGLAVYNYGTVRNGMVYSPRWLQAITGVYKGDTETARTECVGGLVAYNYSGGLLSNIYGVLNLGVERDKRLAENGTISLSTNGILVGGMGGGRVENCFTVGDLYELYWSENNSGLWGRSYRLYETYTPVGGGTTSDSTIQSRFRNSFYFTQTGLYKKSVPGYLENAMTYLRLTDQNFYDGTVNTQEDFHTEDVASGYYPRVEMTEELINRQQRISYSRESAASGITYVGAVVTDQQEDYADMTLTFSNPLGYQVKDLQIEYLRANAQTATSPEDAPLPYEQYVEGSFYYVKIRVWPNGQYRDSYRLGSFGITLGSYESTQTVVNRNLAVSFYKPVDMENWISAFDDAQGNYRLKSDIDMAAFAEQNQLSAKKVFSGFTSSRPFKGKLDGNGKTIKNLNLTEVSDTFIPYVDGAVVTDLTFDNVSIGDATASSNYMGIFGNVKGQSRLEDVYALNVTLQNPYQYAGGLTAYLDNSTLLNCGVQGLSVSAEVGTLELQAGGLAGTSNYGHIENCYASSVDMNISAAQANVLGAGGIVGYMSSSANITETYAQGRIYTLSGDAGGIAGRSNGIINSCWAKVDVSGQGIAGGIIGRAQSSSRSSQLLAVGNVSGQITSGGRIWGIKANDGLVLTNAWAYEGQQINGTETEELLDANGIMTDIQMQSAPHYWNNINMGSGFCYDTVEQGYLPGLYADGTAELLKYQKQILYKLPEDMVSLTVEEGASAQYREDTNSYELEFALFLKTPGVNRDDLNAGKESFYDSLYEALNNLSISGLDLKMGLEEVADGTITMQDFWANHTAHFSWKDSSTLRLTFPEAEIEIYRDSYQAVYRYEQDGSVWELSAILDFGTPLYYHIDKVYNESNPEDMTSWYGAMKAEGKNYQNFMITKSLNFGDLPSGWEQDPELVNLNINRLVGEGFTDPVMESEQKIKDYLLFGKQPDQGDGNATVSVPDGPEVTLSNLNYSTSANGQSWIRLLQGTMEGLKFENIQWNSTGGGTNVGLIGRNTGTIQYTDFSDITLNVGTASSYAGCVAYNQGTMEFVRASGITLTNAINSRISYTGGLVGQSEFPLTHCGVTDSEITVNSASETSHSSYTGGLVGYNSSYTRYCYADSVTVSGRTGTGGLAGYSYNLYGQNDSYIEDEIRYNDIFYYAQVTNSEISGRFNTGAVYGTASNGVRNISIGNTVIQTGSGAYGAGGIMGANGGYSSSWNYVEDCTVTTEGAAAGGVIGIAESVGFCTVKDTSVKAAQSAGGIAGTCSTSTIYSCQVDHCTIEVEDNYAGGAAGYAAANSSSGNAFRDLVINNGTQVTGAGGSQYVGGILGASYGKSIQNVIVDDSVTVSGFSYVGGICGLAAGGTYERMESGAHVKGTGNDTGGFAGSVIGYMQQTVSYSSPTNPLNITLISPQTIVTGVIISGKIEGNNRTGGFAGEFSPGDRPIDPDTGSSISDEISGYIPYLNQKHYSKIVLAPLSVTGTEENTVQLICTLSGNQETGENAGIGYLRVYASIDGGKVQEEIEKLPSLEDKLLEPAGNLTEKEALDSYTVKDTTLASPDFYAGSVTAGGLALNSSSNRYFDTTRMGTESEGEEQKNTTFPLLKANSYTRLLFEKSEVSISGTTKEGHYLQWCFNTSMADCPARDSIRTSEQIQDGILLPQEAKAGAQSTLMFLKSDADIAVEPDSLVRYPSGIDRLNLDISQALCGYGLEWQVENADGEITASGMIDSLPSAADGTGPRTLTLRYDFRSYLTVTIKDKDETLEVYAIDPAGVCRTLSSSGDDQYYIRGDGVVSVKDSALVAEGNFVHLYGDEAMDINGRVVNLKTGDGRETAEELQTGTACFDAQPAYTTETDTGTVVKTYSDYSLVSSDGLTAFRRFRIFVKNGQTYAVDADTAREDGAGLHDLIADAYDNGENSYQYLSYLTADGSVKDLGDRLHWPEELQNSGIGEIAGNITGTEPVLLVRYQDNTVAAFQYLTGNLLMQDTSEKKEMNFLQYATVWLVDLKQQFGKADNTAYLAAVTLAEDLKMEPVDTELALNVTGKGDAQSSNYLENAETAERVTAGSNTLEGVLNAAAADWKQEALEAGYDKAEHLLGTAAEMIEKEIKEAFDQEGEEETEKTEGTEQSMEITPDNLETLKEAAVQALEKEELKSALRETLKEAGVEEKETAALLDSYGEALSRAAEKAVSVSGENTTKLSDGNYIVSMNAESGGYEVYKEDELLDASVSAETLMSENQKIIALKEAGYYQDSGVDLEELKLTAEENKEGILLLSAAGAGVLLLLGVMYRKRKKMN